MSEGVGILHAIRISMQKSYTKDKVVSDDYLPYKLQGHLQVHQQNVIVLNLS